MSDIQPTESERKGFKSILKTLYWYSGFGYMPSLDDDDYLNDCLRVSERARADAVKAERKRCIEAARSEKVEAVKGSESDEAYNRAIDDACRAILQGTAPTKVSEDVEMDEPRIGDFIGWIYFGDLKASIYSQALSDAFVSDGIRPFLLMRREDVENRRLVSRLKDGNRG